MDKQLARRFGNVQVVFKEALNGEQRLVVERFDRPALEHFLQEHFAQRCGQLVNQAGNAEVVIADDRALGVEHLADLQRDLGFLKGTGQVLDAGHDGADSHHAVGVKLAGQRVDNGAGQFVQVLRLDAGADFLDQGDVAFIDIDDKVLALVREQVLHHVVSGDIGLVGDFDQHADAAHVGVEAELARFQINIARKDVVEDHVLDKVAAVVFFVVILLDAAQRNRKQGGVAAGLRVAAGNKHRVFRPGPASEGFVGVPVDDEGRR